MFGIHKGGCAKTTTALEAAAYCSARGKSVLVVDVDPQANISSTLLGDSEPKGRKLCEIVIKHDIIRLEDINSRYFPNGTKVDFVCSNVRSGRIESKIEGESPKEYVISEALDTIKNDYDVIIIDTPPSAEILSLSSMIAADELIVTTCADQHSTDGVESILALASKIQTNPRLNPNLKVRGIVVTRYRFSLSTRHHISLLRANKDFGHLVVEPYVRECTKAQQAITNNLPVSIFEPSCSTSKDYSEVFSSLFAEV